MKNTVFAIVAVMAAALLTGAMVIAPAAYAGGHGGGYGDGNTVTKQKNKGTAIASGFDTTALIYRLNTICAGTVPLCI